MFERIRSFFGASSSDTVTTGVDDLTISVEDLPSAILSAVGGDTYDYTGDKWAGSFGGTKIYNMDYWTLRKRSKQLFEDNLYASGIIRRLITNVINTGLRMESEPEEGVLGFEEDSLADWSESIETQFSLWGGDDDCDFHGRRNFGRIQADVKRQAIIEGDVLVILRVKGAGRLKVQVIDGDRVENPLLSEDQRIPKGHTVDWGVEWDANGREVAYWYRQDDGKHTRIATHGTRSGRRISKLVRGIDNMVGHRRGTPLLHILLHSIRDLDRYRDAAVRKALLNAVLAIFIKKGESKLGTNPLTGPAQRRGTQTVVDGDGVERKRAINNHTPGIVLEELQQGEEPVAHSINGTDTNLPEFEEAIIHSMAWSLEIPPEIMKLAFSSNYSASAAATNEFKLFLARERFQFSDEFCNFVLAEWFLVESLAGRIDRWSEIFLAWRDRKSSYDFKAWVKADWSGAIKQSTDLVKSAKGYSQMISDGLITRDRAARDLTGMKHSRVVKKLTRENEKLAEANQPIVDLNTPDPQPSGGDNTQAIVASVTDAVEDILENHQGV